MYLLYWAEKSEKKNIHFLLQKTFKKTSLFETSFRALSHCTLFILNNWKQLKSSFRLYGKKKTTHAYRKTQPNLIAKKVISLATTDRHHRTALFSLKFQVCIARHSLLAVYFSSPFVWFRFLGLHALCFAAEVLTLVFLISLPWWLLLLSALFLCFVKEAFPFFFFFHIVRIFSRRLSDVIQISLEFQKIYTAISNFKLNWILKIFIREVDEN